MGKWVIEKHIPTYDYVSFAVETLSRIYPFLEVETIGYSRGGRSIYALNLGNRESRVIYTGATHGSEWLTTLVLFRFIEDLCRHYRSESTFSSVDTKLLFEEKGASFIPLLNPDGVEINLTGYAGAGDAYGEFVKSTGADTSSWNANAGGVDINHNFDAGWEELRQMEQKAGINQPGPRQYGGAAPESEPETYALAKYCRDNYFSAGFALHSQGEEIYYKFEDYKPPKAQLMAKVLSASSGYALVQQGGLASYGGFKDWFIKEFNRACFTVEIGRGKNPLPMDMLEPIYKKIREMLLLGMLF